LWLQKKKFSPLENPSNEKRKKLNFFFSTNEQKRKDLGKRKRP
jgi:hypothetical protein